MTNTLHPGSASLQNFAMIYRTGVPVRVARPRRLPDYNNQDSTASMQFVP